MAYTETLFEGDHGILWAYDGALPNDPEAVDPAKIRFVARPDPAFTKLFAASITMYKVANEVETALSSLIVILEDRGGDDLVSAVQSLASNLRTVQRLADEGSAKLFGGTSI